MKRKIERAPAGVPVQALLYRVLVSLAIARAKHEFHLATTMFSPVNVWDEVNAARNALIVPASPIIVAR